MEDKEKYSPKRFKRSRSESEEDVEVEDRVSVIQQRKQNQEELEVREDKQSSDYYCRKGPSLSENSISNILKVVSLQSFSSSPRLAPSEALNGHQTTRSFGCRLNGSDSPPPRSNGESSPSSEDSVGTSYRPAPVLPSRNSSRKSSSRGKRGEKANNPPKDEKYWEKRVRNNASAKRSRDARRVRELECQIRSEYMEDENRKLEDENKLLREENMTLLKMIEELKSRD
ncbi:transcription factor VBP-like [Actinia tenebrosa]|uniref:Transcription factor VBP-like n=1 Tax=Actinia tenebrosa TaxID=6105 RepID=A0A6P8J0V7_ACTTE|nr:transcription factor VBP-like [Actinia tenebrosa]